MAISKINSLALASVAKVNGLLKASIAKIGGLVNVLFTDNISFDFDGTNDYLTRATIGSLETTGSVSAWVKLDSMSANGFIFQLRAESGTDDQIILLWNNASAVIRGNVKFGGTTNVVDSGSGLENDGMLVRGFVTLDHDPGTVGDTLFLSTTAGQASSTPPIVTGKQLH